MSIPPIELPARDSDHVSVSERTPESHKGILAWMGRHKLVTALAGTAMLAGGVYATPGAWPWVAENLALLWEASSKKVRVWIKMFIEWLIGKTIPDDVKNIVKFLRGLQKGAGHVFDTATAIPPFAHGTAKGAGTALGYVPKTVVDGVGRLAESVGAVSETPAGASVQGAVRGSSAGAKGVAEGLMQSNVGLKALKDWFLGK